MQTNILKKILRKPRITFIRKDRYNCVERCRTKDKNVNVMEEKMEKEILKEKYNVGEKYIKLLTKICKDNKISNIEETIKKYIVCQKGVSNQKES